MLYLNGPTLYRLPINNDHLNGMEQQLRALWAAINKAIDTDNFPPRPGRLCDWCSFKNLCPAFEGETQADLAAAL